MRLVAVLGVLAGCWAQTPTYGTKAWDPKVDMVCVEHARAGTLADLVPAEAAGFAIKPAAEGFVLSRAGTVMTTEASRDAWKVLGEQVFMRGGLSGGDAAIGSIYKCDGVADASCFHYTLWVCQLTVGELAQRIASALDQHGFAGTEVVVGVKFEEQRGPSCKLGAACTPAQHYSTHGQYDRNGARISLHDGMGACRDDGDCDGGNSDFCRAWYLGGGGEAASYLQRSEPTFCGCLDKRCTWFTQ